MNFKGVIVASALAPATFMGAPGSARADVTYVVDATFDDGTTVTGDFVLNVYGNPSTWDLTTSTGLIHAYTYTRATTYGSDCGSNCVMFADALPYAYDGGLKLTFAHALGGYGADGILVGSGGPSWQNSSNVAGYPPIRFIESGVATGAPEPATWAMMLLGFLSLAFAGYRKGTL